MKLTTIFYHVDNFCKEFEKNMHKFAIPGIDCKRKPTSSMKMCDVLTILVYFHYSKKADFKSYYIETILGEHNSAFKPLLSYSRFIEIMPRYIVPIFFFAKTFKIGDCSGISFIDSFSIPVCHNKRIYANKVFKGSAKRGKTSIGWFFGYKLHLVINEKGQIIDFTITPGNVSDNNKKIVKKITHKINGKLIGDKGYISSKLFKELYQKGIKLVTKARKNMKNQLMELFEKFLLRKRGVIESVGNLLKNYFKMQHTRHRSMWNFFVNLFSSLAAYNLKERKPAIFKEKTGPKLLDF